MDHYQYLIVMGACLAVTAPLEVLGARVYRRPARLVRAVLPVAAVFLIWDALAVAGGVWTYNPRYVTGLRLPFRIPVEELVFFLVIPVCGILTYAGVQAVTARWHARRSRHPQPRPRTRPRPSRAAPRRERPERAVPAERAERAVPAERPERAVPAERAERAVPAERAERAVPAERAERAVRS
jgi:lycopene cyclase domain-containing protein